MSVIETFLNISSQPLFVVLCLSTVHCRCFFRDTVCNWTIILLLWHITDFSSQRMYLLNPIVWRGFTFPCAPYSVANWVYQDLTNFYYVTRNNSSRWTFVTVAMVWYHKSTVCVYTKEMFISFLNWEVTGLLTNWLGFFHATYDCHTC